MQPRVCTVPLTDSNSVRHCLCCSTRHSTPHELSTTHLHYHCRHFTPLLLLLYIFLSAVPFNYKTSLGVTGTIASCLHLSILRFRSLTMDADKRWKTMQWMHPREPRPRMHKRKPLLLNARIRSPKRYIHGYLAAIINISTSESTDVTLVGRPWHISHRC